MAAGLVGVTLTAVAEVVVPDETALVVGAGVFAVSFGVEVAEPGFPAVLLDVGAWESFVALAIALGLAAAVFEVGVFAVVVLARLAGFVVLAEVASAVAEVAVGDTDMVDEVGAVPAAEAIVLEASTPVRLEVVEPLAGAPLPVDFTAAPFDLVATMNITATRIATAATMTMTRRSQ